MKAAIYTRFSSDRQREASTDDQARNCRRRVEAEGWLLAHHFRDEAMSGSTAARPGYQALLRAAERREFDVLVVDDLSRLSRDQVESERTIRRLEFAGIRIVALSDGYDSTSKARKVHRGVKGLMNELYLDDLRDKTHRGLSGQALAKFSAGGKAYGYRPVRVTDPARLDSYGEPTIVGHRREIDPQQADIVREIFTRYAAGESMKAIAADLNARKIPSPGSTWRRKTRRKDGVWLQSTIYAILHNEIYVGQYIWNRSRWERDPESRARRRIERPRSEWIVHEMPELQIVPADLWQRVQERLSARAESFAATSPMRRGGQPKYLLSGILECAVCGAKLVVSGTRPARYVCSTHTNGGHHACSNRLGVSRLMAEDRVLGTLRDELLSPAAIAFAEREFRRLCREIEAESAGADTNSNARVAKFDPQIAELERLLAAGILSPDVAGAALEKARAERQSALRADSKTGDQRVVKLQRALPRAAAAYRAEVERMGDVLTDLSAVHRARAALQDCLGGPLKLKPSDDGTYLVAEMDVGPGVLLRTAGADSALWIGSGGRI